MVNMDCWSIMIFWIVGALWHFALLCLQLLLSIYYLLRSKEIVSYDTVILIVHSSKWRYMTYQVGAVSVAADQTPSSSSAHISLRYAVVTITSNQRWKSSRFSRKSGFFLCPRGHSWGWCNFIEKILNVYTIWPACTGCSHNELQFWYCVLFCPKLFFLYLAVR